MLAVSLGTAQMTVSYNNTKSQAASQQLRKHSWSGVANWEGRRGEGFTLAETSCLPIYCLSPCPYSWQEGAKLLQECTCAHAVEIVENNESFSAVHTETPDGWTAA